MVYGDHGQLLTALRNLLANAIAYSPSHTRVAVELAADGESIVEISVKDQGIGIPVNDLDRIFERFYRVDQARSRVTGGTGLGLAIVKHVCQNHGGECTVWSEPGVGSTFTLRLPAYQASTPFDRGDRELEVDHVTIPSGEVHRDARPGRGGRGVVLRGAVLHAAPGGVRGRGRGRRPSAIDVFERHGADLILLDLMLPGTVRNRGLPAHPGLRRRCRSSC